MVSMHRDGSPRQRVEKRCRSHWPQWRCSFRAALPLAFSARKWEAVTNCQLRRPTPAPLPNRTRRSHAESRPRLRNPRISRRASRRTEIDEGVARARREPGARNADLRAAPRSRRHVLPPDGGTRGSKFRTASTHASATRSWLYAKNSHAGNQPRPGDSSCGFLPGLFLGSTLLWLFCRRIVALRHLPERRPDRSRTISSSSRTILLALLRVDASQLSKVSIVLR
jgi:hypothetical protein